MNKRIMKKNRDFSSKKTKPIQRQNTGHRIQKSKGRISRSHAKGTEVRGQRSEAGRRWTRKMIVDEWLGIFYTCAGFLMPLTNKALSKENIL